MDIAFINQGQTENRWHTPIRIIEVCIQKDLLQRHRWGVRNHNEYSRPTPFQAQRDKDRGQLIKSGRNKSPRELNALRGRNHGKKYPELPLLSRFRLLPWLFQPEVRAHKEPSDAVYTFSQGKGAGERRVPDLEGQVEDSGTRKKGCLWTN